MRMLVTGCAGFIGSRLVAALLAQEHEVLGIDCFTPYYDPAIKRARLRPLLDDGRFTFEEANLCTANLERVADIDSVFHLAGQPGVRSSWGASFTDYTDNNLVATQRLLEASRTAREAPNLIFASSSSVYGDAESYPTSEEAPPRPISPYGVTKLAAEHLIDAYRRSFGQRAVVLRYFTVYGPGQRPDMGLDRFIRAMLLDEQLNVFGDGEQIRDVTYVDDVVQATIAASTLGDAQEPINIAGGSQVSVNELLQHLATLIGKQPSIVHQPPADGDVRRTGGDTSRAHRLLGYEPAVSIQEGLPRQVARVRETLG